MSWDEAGTYLSTQICAFLSYPIHLGGFLLIDAAHKHVLNNEMKLPESAEYGSIAFGEAVLHFSFNEFDGIYALFA